MVVVVNLLVELTIGLLGTQSVLMQTAICLLA